MRSSPSGLEAPSGRHRSVTIRRARAGDADALAYLLTELGYPSQPDQVGERLQRAFTGARSVVLVAEEDLRVVGLATVHIFSVLNRSRDVAWLTALVVDEAARGRGIGRRLVEAVEAFARDSNCERLSVTTHEGRLDARAFYERIGLEATGRRFGKMLE